MNDIIIHKDHMLIVEKPYFSFGFLLLSGKYVYNVSHEEFNKYKVGDEYRPKRKKLRIG